MSYKTQDQVHAPYHFVPLSKWIYMPDWAHLVSHDHPFEDGVSGCIEYTLTNKTPLCVGAQQTKDANGISVVEWARNPDKKPVIPGASLKGMIRSVLEIASFGKFNAIDDHHFSFRDISNAETKYAKEIHESDAQAYWLKFDSEKQTWTLDKAEHTVLFHDEFNKYSRCKIENVAFKQPADKKYQQWPLSQQAIKFDLEDRLIQGTKGKDVNVTRASEFGKGEFNGYPVFSGFRPGKREHTLKRLNFSYIFYSEENQAVTFSNSDEMVQKLFANHDEALVNYLKNNPHPTLGIPVFAREVNNKIIALGFAKMPRKLYNKSVKEVAQQSQALVNSDNIFDLSELMFGTLREKGLSLKSRITFSDANCSINQGIANSPASILGQPKASYLSAYLEQKANKGNIVINELNQYESTSQLKGWKRYPAQTQFTAHLPRDVADKVNVQSKLELMKEQSQFKGQIVFHNLKQIELGALLWCLQFEQQKNKAMHSLGHGKPLGAGAVYFDNLALTAISNNHNKTSDINTLISSFIDNMNQAHPANVETSWQDSIQLKHLFGFADQQDNQDKNLSYMPLQTARGERYISYSESVKGREKKILPNWSHKGEELNRVEQATQNTPSAFGRGRLHALIEHCHSENNLSQTEQKMLAEAQEKALLAQQEREKKDKLASMTPCAQLVFELKEKLNTAEPTTIAPLLREHMAIFLSSDDFTSEAALQFYQLARKNEYHKKPKKRNKEQKAELAKLVEQYKLQVG